MITCLCLIRNEKSRHWERNMLVTWTPCSFQSQPLSFYEQLLRSPVPSHHRSGHCFYFQKTFLAHEVECFSICCTSFNALLWPSQVNWLRTKCWQSQRSFFFSCKTLWVMIYALQHFTLLQSPCLAGICRKTVSFALFNRGICHT